MTGLDQATVDYVTARARELLDESDPAGLDDQSVWAELGRLRWAVRRLLDLVDYERDAGQERERIADMVRQKLGCEPPLPPQPRRLTAVD